MDLMVMQHCIIFNCGRLHKTDPPSVPLARLACQVGATVMAMFCEVKATPKF